PATTAMHTTVMNMCNKCFIASANIRIIREIRPIKVAGGLLVRVVRMRYMSGCEDSMPKAFHVFNRG
uniref:hypothetical protein n=1 Tax=uncultured Muribaculum sp. TaxID=1918613 RepID=UPI0026E06F7C